MRHLAGKTFWRLYNTKISKYTCHRLPFYAFRNKFECLETRPFNFERNGLFAKLSVAFGHFTVCCFLKGMHTAYRAGPERCYY